MVDGRSSTLTSRPIYSRADVQKIKWPSEYGELSVALRSLDHFVRAQQQRLRHGESERLRGLQVDH
jgi:hypothetical protein